MTFLNSFNFCRLQCDICYRFDLVFKAISFLPGFNPVRQIYDANGARDIKEDLNARVDSTDELQL